MNTNLDKQNTGVPKGASYILPLKTSFNTEKKSIPKLLSEDILLKNALWFCKLRWLVILALTAFGLLSFTPDLIKYFGIKPATNWPFVTAGILVIVNCLFYSHARQMKTINKRKKILINLWQQIFVDLLVLTAVVHYVGSLETYIAFTYLFHIVLACIFLSRVQSFMVTLIASILYIGCVSLEATRILSPKVVYFSPLIRINIEKNSGVLIINVFSAVGIWFVVWFLTSKLSSMVRRREYELAQTNYRLLQAQKEKTKHMLQTTHELKAPFAAIQANTQLLLKGYCGPISDKGQEVLEKIAARCRKLTGEIQEMLQLANLRSKSQPEKTIVTLDLKEIISWCINHLKPLAEERKVLLETELQSIIIRGNEDYLKMMFQNLITNAILYSYENSKVKVHTGYDEQKRPQVFIIDYGIGIAEEKIPKIFDEYYRTDEAVRHNKSSTGLGLTIVKHIAQTYNIQIEVKSKLGQGTQFILTFNHKQVTSKKEEK